nr:MAG: putative capsid protein 2 [Polycipiviridae sp.]
MSLNEEINMDTHNPVRNYGLPQNPVPQTNTGLLEHTGIPFVPLENITSLPPQFSWMVEQYKIITTVPVSTTNAVGSIILSTDVLHPNNGNTVFRTYPNWERIPFSSSIWWKGIVSYRLSIIKPPRVTGKLLVRYRQDNFLAFNGRPANNSNIKDSTYRSILKEWDLSDSNHFTFDISASLPIRARPTKFPGIKSISPSTATDRVSYATTLTPWIDFSMGAISLEVAETIAPGSIFPDSYTIIVERAFKDTEFMIPTDSKSTYSLCVKESPFYTAP